MATLAPPRIKAINVNNISDLSITRSLCFTQYGLHNKFYLSLIKDQLQQARDLKITLSTNGF